MSKHLDPSHIMQVGMGFWPSKTVLSAVELQLFTHLGAETMTGIENHKVIALDHEKLRAILKKYNRLNP